MDVQTDDFSVSLPFDVVIEILSRLPVRSILRFRCVCKSWYALFSDHSFVEKHLKASTENEDYANHRLLISSYFSVDVKSCPITSVSHEGYSAAHSLDYPGRSSDAQVWIVGSVNGLVFIIVDKVGLFIWNPATRESKRLPQNGFEKDYHPYIAYGFGYDESSSDYKVVVLKTHFRRDTRPFKIEVKIYGLKSNAWRKIGNLHECDLLGDSGVFVSGAIHWPAFIGTELNINESILTFDLSEETFSEISLPSDGESFLDLIGVLDGSLCVLYDIDETKVDVWVMKEYGEMESWCKMFSLTLQHDPRGFHHSAPLFLFRKNELLLMIGVDLVLYNVESKTVSLSLIRDLCRITEINTYIETLVSPYHERLLQL